MTSQLAQKPKLAFCPTLGYISDFMRTLLCAKASTRFLTRSLLPTCPHSSVPDRLMGMSNIGKAAAAAGGGQPANNMVDDTDWSGLGTFLAQYDEKREVIIKRCRDSQKLAKQAVYSLHRGDMAKVQKQLDEVEAIARELSPILQEHPNLRYGSYAATIEEYVEAMAFKTFLEEGRLIKASEVALAEPEEYLGGVLDMAGELNRWAIARATARDSAAVQRGRDLVDALMGRFLQFDLRNGALRKKFDGLKYTLKKLENTLYELSLTVALGTTRDMGHDEEMDTAAGQTAADE